MAKNFTKPVGYYHVPWEAGTTLEAGPRTRITFDDRTSAFEVWSGPSLYETDDWVGSADSLSEAREIEYEWFRANVIEQQATA